MRNLVYMAKLPETCTDCDFKSSCFQQLNDEELFLTNESKVQVNYKKGETIAKQGAFVTHILYIKEGLVKAYRENEDNTNTIYNIFPKGSLIGLSALFQKEIFDYSVAALSNSRVCAIDRKVIQQIINDNNQFAVSVIKSLNEEISQLRNKMISLTLKQLHGRLADSILYLSDKVYQMDSFKLNLSRKDLAEYSGMSTMSVVRTMQKFIKEGIIEENKGVLSILNKSGLETLADVS